MLNFGQIRVFVEVADTLNFTAAANRLYISQQGISSHISNIEKELGLRLFVRNTRKVELTPAGRVLHSAWKSILEQNDDAIQVAASLHAKSQKRLIVGIGSSEKLVKMAKQGINAYLEANPDVELEYKILPFRKLRSLLIRGEIDVIISISPEIDDIEPAPKTANLSPLRPWIILSKRHHLATKEQLSIKDLDGQSIFIFSEAFSFDVKDKMGIIFEKYAIQPSDIRCFDTVDELELALYAGKGITLTFDIFFDSADNRLKFYSIDEEIPKEIGANATTAVVAWFDDSNARIKDFSKAMVQLIA